MKENLNWFTHEGDLGEQAPSAALIAVCGFEGYGRYNRLRELISRQDGGRLDLTKKVYRYQVAGALHMSGDALDEFLSFLGDPDECGLLVYEDGILSDCGVDDDLSRAYRKREYDKNRKSGQNDAEETPEEDESEPDTESPTTPAGVTTESERNRDGVGTENRHIHTYIHTNKQPARAEPPVENPVDNLREFIKTHRPDIRKPGAFARRVVEDPESYEDLLAEYQDSKRPPRRIAEPPPRKCPDCGGHLTPKHGKAYFVEGRQIVECDDCKRSLELDHSTNTWGDSPERKAV